MKRLAWFTWNTRRIPILPIIANGHLGLRTNENMASLTKQQEPSLCSLTKEETIELLSTFASLKVYTDYIKANEVILSFSLIKGFGHIKLRNIKLFNIELKNRLKTFDNAGSKKQPKIAAE